MEFFVKGKGKVKLDKRNFVGQGGEGAIYTSKGTAYKIYTDPTRMIPVAKIQELACLAKSTIINPQDILLDRKNRPVGYSMQYLGNTHPLCKLFTKSFRDREGITPDMILKLVRGFQTDVDFVHKKGVLIVDLNEMNFLVASDFGTVYFIDVDSYQTPHFPATAIMESIRDRHASRFSEVTDWFSFGVVSFELFVGIHPYKGKCKTCKGFDARMIQNISVFNRAVKIPNVCQDFSVIPEVYRKWYKAVFEDGKRIAPPATLQEMVILVSAKIKHVTGNNNFDITRVFNLGSEVFGFVSDGGRNLILTSDGVHLGKKKIAPAPGKMVVGFTSRMSWPVGLDTDGKKAKVFDLRDGSELNLPLRADSVMSCDAGMFVKKGDKIVRVEFNEVGQKIVASASGVCGVLENATKLYEGVAVQDLLGAWYLCVMEPPKSCHQVKVDELKGYRIVDARYQNHVCMVIGEKKGSYDKFVVRFDKDFHSYDVRKIEDITLEGPNFVVLQSGVCVHILEDGKLEVFSNQCGSKTVKLVEDDTVTSDMRLFTDGARVLFGLGNALYHMSMK